MEFLEKIPSRLGLIPDFISMTIEKLFYLPLDEEIIFQIKLALHEAVINAIKHGNELDSSRFVTVAIRSYENRVVIEVTDEGPGFDIRKIPDPTKGRNVEKLTGRGIFLIRHLMNDVRFSNNGRTIQMVKLLKKERRGKMKIQIQEADGVTVVLIDGEINISSSPDLRGAFIKAIDKGATRFLVDFEKVTFIDSSGLATIIELDQRMKKVNGSLRLCHLSKKVRGIFEITKIHKLIPMYDNRETALKEF